MNTMPHKREIIDRYLLDELTESERESFEEEIREDESLRQEVDLMRHISIALQRKGEKDAWHKHVSAKYKRRLIVVLSAVAAAAVAIVIFLRQGSEPAYTGEQLFADYFIAGELEIVPQRGGTITAEVARNETLYRQSLKLITLHNPALPIENFTYLSSLPDFEYREEAGWTLALIYVKHNRREQAKEALRPLIVSKSFYASKASELSRKLDETRWFN